ncbi:hypothetical protein CkaCkLH20_07687 [Colletotrichum karsti]|uniref:DUF7730 domain-containing protein n=1 Tax=Colletotrichum karsti TaxID=1095194 RepID=A0A9P6LIU0_9PEZI|nr:uncharacterized protein CkaCkLH20_07687 [Colletotrichum karsti]KAF9874993.1 hypothetical protein CkaCkLH20_07687 [Colletotrichum karsti]
MKDESRRAGRLGVRSLAKKTVCLIQALTRNTRRTRKEDGVRVVGVQPKLCYDSDSSITLPSLNSFNPSFGDFWTDFEPRNHDHASDFATHGQSQSNFFVRLPQEIREMIYQELWRDSGTAQHIIRTPAGYTHCRCVFDQSGKSGGRDGDDDLWEAMWMVPDARGSGPLWYKREMSSWGDHWKCEEAREEKEIWKDIARGCHCIKVDTWTAFLPMMLTCKRMYHQCAASLYQSLNFTITDITLARSLFGIRYRGSAGHPFRRINLSLRRHVHEGTSFAQWLKSWSAILRLLDTPELTSVYLWLDSDICHERHWLSIAANVRRRIPESLTHKVAVSLPPYEPRDRDAEPVWLGVDEAPSGPAPDATDGHADEAKCFGVRRLRT